MDEIELSIFQHSDDVTQNMQTLLAQFEKQERIHVNLTVMPFPGAWARMVEFALYQHGPDVSQVGSTWLGDFERMNALRPYLATEIRGLGGAEAFLPAAWNSGSSGSEGVGGSMTWGIPWLADTRVIFYRKDVLEQAGIDETTAFASSAALDATLSRIQETSQLAPLSLSTQRSRITLHNLASWIWNEGGEFLSPDGKKILFDQPAARQGMRQYFSLAKYLSPSLSGLDDSQAGEAFIQGQAAVTVSGHWLVFGFGANPQIQQCIRIAPLPGISFAGGFHLVIWQHSRKATAAYKLVEFLAGRNTPNSLFPSMGLPVRKDTIDNTPLKQQPLFKELIGVLDGARSFPSGHIWGLVEKQLTDLAPYIWKDILSLPDRSDIKAIDAILDQYLTPLARRLKITIG
ncbi:MAG TPA: extracellular solute-binding protein [Anaerolineales bacterium]|nr:extracellular solute-binding protein [Anaerolineales bacterium]